MFYYLLKLIHLFLCLSLCSFLSSYLSFCQSLPTIFPAVWVNLCQISQQPLQVTMCICLIGCQPGSAGPRHQLVFLWQRLLETWHLWLRMNGNLAHLLNTNYQIGNDFSFCSDHSSKRDQRPVQMPFDQSVTWNIDFSWLCACVLV